MIKPANRSRREGARWIWEFTDLDPTLDDDLEIESRPAVSTDHRGDQDRVLTYAERHERIVVFVHGGDEYRAQVNETQRRWTRWLVAQGAGIVAGAHPHVVRREERHAGATVLHSLGNAVFPAGLKGADSGVLRVVELP